MADMLKKLQHHWNVTTRRDFFTRAGSGLAAIALAAMADEDARGAVVDPLAPKQPHVPPRAKSVIWCFMEGGPSQLDLFDPKPLLEKMALQPVPASFHPEQLLTAQGAKPSDEDWGDGDDGNNHRFRFHEQPSQPQSGEMEYHDDAANIHMLSTNGVQAVAYNGSCVSFTGPATVNGAAGYMFNFEACDLSGTAPLALGTYAITITPPVGSLALPYSHNGTLNLGTIVIHPH